MRTSGVRDNCGGLPPPPVEHARSTQSFLAPIGIAAKAALSCRVLGKNRDQASGHCMEHLSVLAARQVYPRVQGCDSNKSLYSVTMPPSVMCSEMIGAESCACSQTPSGGGS